MPVALAASILDALLALALGPADQESPARISLEGVTIAPGKDGATEIGIAALEAASFHAASGPFVVELGRLALRQLVAVVRVEEGRPRLCAFEAAGVELSGLKVHGPWIPSTPSRGDSHAMRGQGGPPAAAVSAPDPAISGSWSLGPLAAAEGTLRAEIVDAHLLFDADVTVPIRQGQVAFNDATVEHVGPDSRMGVSRLGIYVDAPNGRSYLYQFSSAPLAGVEYERRGAMLGPWVTHRGSLSLQPFGESLLRQGLDGRTLGFTEQARLLFDRTAVSGDLQLGDGKFAAPGVQAELAGRAEGRNLVRFHSEAVGRGVTVNIASLSVRNAVAGSSKARVRCDGMAGALMLRLFVEGAQLRFAFELPEMKLSGLRLDLHPLTDAAPRSR